MLHKILAYCHNIGDKQAAKIQLTDQSASSLFLFVYYYYISGVFTESVVQISIQYILLNQSATNSVPLIENHQVQCLLIRCNYNHQKQGANINIPNAVLRTCLLLEAKFINSYFSISKKQISLEILSHILAAHSTNKFPILSKFIDVEMYQIKYFFPLSPVDSFTSVASSRADGKCSQSQKTTKKQTRPKCIWSTENLHMARVYICCRQSTENYHSLPSFSLKGTASSKQL